LPITLHIEKKRSERRKHWPLAVVRQSQKFRPSQTLFLGAQDSQNLITYRPNLVKI